MCGQLFIGLVIIFALIVAFGLFTLYYSWASAFYITQYPNLNFVIVTLVILTILVCIYALPGLIAIMSPDSYRSIWDYAGDFWGKVITYIKNGLQIFFSIIIALFLLWVLYSWLFAK